MVCSNLRTLTPLRCTAWFVRAVGAAVRPDHPSGEPHDRIIQAKAEQRSTAQARALAFVRLFAFDRPSVFPSVPQRSREQARRLAIEIATPASTSDRATAGTIHRPSKSPLQPATDSSLRHRPRIDSPKPSERWNSRGGGSWSSTSRSTATATPVQFSGSPRQTHRSPQG